MSNIPFYSGAASFRQNWPILKSKLDEICKRGVFSDGPISRELEQAITSYTGATHAIACGNATDALIVALRALDIGPGDEVIVPVYTFFASASSIAHVGATPVFVDIDPVTYSIDPELIHAAITPRTKAIMPVHLFTQMANMPMIMAIADAHGIAVIEDSAEGIGMWCDDRHAGLVGRIGVLSFFPTKTLGAIGDAGMVLTHDANLARRCRRLVNHGRDPSEPFVYHEAGFNSKLDEIQAAVLLNRLERLHDAIASRAILAHSYDKLLASLDGCVVTPKVPTRPYPITPVFYVYLIEAEDRDGLAAYLAERGIGTEVYYPIPLHLQPCFASLGYKRGTFPRAERAAQRAIALPLYPDLTLNHVESVCAAIATYYRGSAV